MSKKKKKVVKKLITPGAGGGRQTMLLTALNMRVDRVLNSITDVIKKLDVLMSVVNKVQQMEASEMASAQDILERVKAQQTVVDGVATLCGQLHDMLQQAKTDPAKLDEAIQLLDQQKDELANAVTANTDAA